MITLKVIKEGWLWVWKYKSWAICFILGFILIVLLYKLEDLKGQVVEANEFHAKYVTEQELATARLNHSWQVQLSTAKDRYIERIKALERDRAVLSANAERMSVALRAAKSKYNAAPEEARTEYTNTLSELLQQCIHRYTDVAQKADGHASDAKLLSEAWPEEIVDSDKEKPP